jgi:TonB family protein
MVDRLPQAFALMNLRIVSPIALVLVVGCASPSLEYSSSDGVRRNRAEAEKAYVGSAAIERNIEGTQLDKPLKALYTPFPDYPTNLRRAEVVGTVRTRFTIGTDGLVSNPTVLGTPDPALAAITLQSITRWRFEPPVVGGKPARIVATQEFVFRLE